MLEATTHCLLDNCNNSNHVLAVQLVGAEIIRSEWILQSRQIGQVRGVIPYEKSYDFYKLFCVHSYSTKEAKWIKVSDIGGNLNEKCGHPGMLYRRLNKVARKVKLK